MCNLVAYFDNAATTFPKPECVYSFMDSFYRECGVNVGRGQYQLASRANSLLEETRELILDLFHCNNKNVVFTCTATEAINLILFGLKIPDKATIYISPFEHNAVTRTLYHLQKTTSFDVEYLCVDKSSYSFDLTAITEQFSQKTPYCVIVSHASNVCGAIAPLSDIFTAAKKHDAITIADMCQTAGLIDTDLSSDIFDYAIFEGHKTLYGPMGIGGFITKNNISLSPLIYGGTGLDSANQDMPDEIPTKYEAGSHNIHAISGLNASLRWISEVGINDIRSKENENRSRLVRILEDYDNITVIDPVAAVGVVSCVFEGYSSDSIGQVLSDNNIAVRTGLHCSPEAHKFLGTFPQGTVRFSVGYFNSDEDFDRLCEVLDYIEEQS